MKPLRNSEKPRIPRRHLGHFGRLAMLYYPDRGYKRAVHLFRQEIQLTRGLLPSLEKIGYKPNQRILTPRMVQVIEEYLGRALDSTSDKVNSD